MGTFSHPRWGVQSVVWDQGPTVLGPEKMMDWWGNPTTPGWTPGATSVGNRFPRLFLVPQVWEKWFSAITGLPWVFPSHQNISGRMSKCGKHSPMLISGATSVGNRFPHLFLVPQVWETGSHACFWCHKCGKNDFLPSLGSLGCSLPIKTYLGGWASVGNTFPRYFLPSLGFLRDFLPIKTHLGRWSSVGNRFSFLIGVGLHNYD